MLWPNSGPCLHVGHCATYVHRHMYIRNIMAQSPKGDSTDCSVRAFSISHAKASNVLLDQATKHLWSPSIIHNKTTYLYRYLAMDGVAEIAMPEFDEDLEESYDGPFNGANFFEEEYDEIDESCADEEPTAARGDDTNAVLGSQDTQLGAAPGTPQQRVSGHR